MITHNHDNSSWIIMDNDEIMTIHDGLIEAMVIHHY